MIPRERLDQFIVRHAELEHLMSGGEALSSDEFVKISKEYSDLTPVVKIAKEYSLPQTLVHLNFVGSNEVTEIKRFSPTASSIGFKFSR